MIICLCNAITDRDVRDAKARGASRPSQVYRDCNCRPDCGKCAPMMRELIREAPPKPALLAAE